MATLARVFRKTEVPEALPPIGGSFADTRQQSAAVRDPYALRALPHADLCFFSKKINNSRLVREPDPKARGTCWSVIGAAAVALVLITGGVLVPSAMTMYAGYRLENLRGEERRLLDERRQLELQEARLLSPERLEKLAQRQNLVTPAAGQVVHLESRPDSAVAMVKP